MTCPFHAPCTPYWRKQKKPRVFITPDNEPRRILIARRKKAPAKIIPSEPSYILFNFWHTLSSVPILAY